MKCKKAPLGQYGASQSSNLPNYRRNLYPPQSSVHTERPMNPVALSLSTIASARNATAEPEDPASNIEPRKFVLSKSADFPRGEWIAECLSRSTSLETCAIRPCLWKAEVSARCGCRPHTREAGQRQRDEEMKHHSE